MNAPQHCEHQETCPHIKRYDKENETLDKALIATRKEVERWKLMYEVELIQNKKAAARIAKLEAQ